MIDFFLLNFMFCKHILINVHCICVYNKNLIDLNNYSYSLSLPEVIYGNNINLVLLQQSLS